MSRRASGYVAYEATAGAAVVAGVGIALVGAGVLVARGIMWCGRRLDENYRAAWTQAVEREWAESWGKVSALRDPVAGRRDAAELRGTLHALRTMTDEAKALALLDAAVLDRLAGPVADLGRSADQLLAGDAGDLEGRIRELRRRVEALQRDTLAAARNGQRALIARTVAEVLAEEGFASPGGGPPRPRDEHDAAVVVGRRTDVGPAGARQDRVVRFDVSRDGEVTYDFSGYAGDACQPDVERVLSGLRARGMFLLDPGALAELERVPAGQVTPETLRDPRFAPETAPNKAQAAKAERILEVVRRMGFSHVVMTGHGGHIDIEGFDGPVGYHVVLRPDGEEQVLRDGEDVTGDAGDALVAAAMHAPAPGEAGAGWEPAEEAPVPRPERRPISE